MTTDCDLAQYAVRMQVEVVAYVTARDEEDAKNQGRGHRLCLRDTQNNPRLTGWASGFPDVLSVEEIDAVG